VFLWYYSDIKNVPQKHNGDEEMYEEMTIDQLPNRERSDKDFQGVSAAGVDFNKPITEDAYVVLANSPHGWRNVLEASSEEVALTKKAQLDKRQNAMCAAIGGTPWETKIVLVRGVPEQKQAFVPYSQQLPGELSILAAIQEVKKKRPQFSNADVILLLAEQGYGNTAKLRSRVREILEADSSLQYLGAGEYETKGKKES
jgi:hypothetical protein